MSWPLGTLLVWHRKMLFIHIFTRSSSSYLLSHTVDRVLLETALCFCSLGAPAEALCSSRLCDPGTCTQLWADRWSRGWGGSWGRCSLWGHGCPLPHFSHMVSETWFFKAKFQSCYQKGRSWMLDSQKPWTFTRIANFLLLRLTFSICNMKRWI